MQTPEKAIVIAMIAMLTAATSAVGYQIAMADNGFTTDCVGPGNSGGEGDCSGNSEGSGPHDETVTNRGGNQPPGQQEDDDD